jgi:Fe-S cluster assembly protein SufB
MALVDDDKIITEYSSKEYEAGFVTDIETEVFAIGLNEDVIRALSAKKNEPEFMLEFRLKAYRKWITMKEPKWAHLKYIMRHPKICLNTIALMKLILNY